MNYIVPLIEVNPIVPLLSVIVSMKLVLHLSRVQISEY